MMVLCCGSRNWSKWGAMNRTLYVFHEIVGAFKLMHGNAQGADRMTGVIANHYGWEVEAVPADWRKHGKRAGFIRNTEMLQRKPDYVVAFWDGSSRGTLDMISKAVNEYRIPTIIVRG